MTSRRTPSLQSPSLGVYCNLAHTLDAIALLPDEAIRAWGQGFDWSQPVERVHVDKAYTRHEAVISGVILVESQNQRLVELLLREDMFERPYGARSDASYLELLETHTTSLVNLTSPNGMLEATLSRALALGDFASVAKLEAWYDKESRYPASAALYASQPIPSRQSALHLVNCHLPPCQIEAVLVHMEARMEAYRGNVHPPAAKSTKAWKEYLSSWHHASAISALEYGNSAMFDCLHARLGHPVTARLLTAALAAHRFDLVETMATTLRDQGGFSMVPDPPHVLSRTVLPPQPVYGSLSEEVASRLVDDSIDKAWQVLAEKIVRGAFVLPTDMSPLCASVAILAQASDSWSPRLLAAINQTLPCASPAELANLLVCAPDSVWLSRSQVASARPGFVDEVFSMPITAFINAAVASGDTDLEERVAPLLACVPPAQAANYCAKWGLANRPGLSAHIDRLRLNQQTAPASSALSRFGRM